MVAVCEVVLAVVASILAVLALTGVIAVWQLYVLGAFRGIAVALGSPARQALVFRIVGRDDLANVVALNSGLGTTARILGPAFGGLVVAATGAGVAFALNAVSYVAVICALLAMRLPERPPRGGESQRVLAGIAEELVFAWSSRRVAVTFLTVLLVDTFSFNFDVLLPLVAGLTLDEGAGTFGLIASVFGGGALCGALILAAVGRARPAAARPRGGIRLRRQPAPARARSTLPAICLILFVAGIFYIVWGRALSRRSSSQPRSTCAAGPRASITSPSWAVLRSAASSQAR